MRRSVWITLGVLAVLAVAVHFATRPPAPSVPVVTPTSSGVSPEAAQTAIARGEDPFASLTPFDNGPGVLVADPLPDAKLPKEATAFGTGCTRWLQFMLSSHPDLGQMPTLVQIASSLYQSGRQNWRLNPDDNRDMELPARSLGMTHVVTGRLSGDAKNLTLSLQLREVPSGEQAGKAVGEAITLSGTPEQITAALPGAAQSLLKALDVPKPHGTDSRRPEFRVPSAVGATPDELTLCGQALLDPWGQRAPALTERLAKIGEKFPLALLIAARDDPGKRRFGPLLMQRAGDNLSVAAYLAETAPEQLAPFPVKWGPLVGWFPSNYQGAMITRWTGSRTGKAARLAAENAVRAAPRNPWAWVDLAETIGDEAGAVRQARTMDQMSPQEMQAVEKLYPLQQAAATRATKLDERSAVAWCSLAVASTFNGDAKAADDALWLAQSLSPEDPRVYSWGLQMYQPKWGGDPKVLFKIAELTAAKDDRLIACGGALAEALQTMDAATIAALPVDDAAPRVQKMWSRLFLVAVAGPKGWLGTQPARRARLSAAWQSAQQQPNNAGAWRALSKTVADVAAALRMGRPYGDLTASEDSVLKVLYSFWQFAARRATALQPKNGAAWLDLSRAISFAPTLVDSADDAFAKALALAPNDPDVCHWGLQMYQPKWGGDPAQLWQLAQRIGSNPALLSALATDVVEALETIQQPDAAQRSLLQKALAQVNAMEKRTGDLEAQKRLEHFWTGHRDYARARRAAENWARLAPGDAQAHFRLGGTLHNSLKNPHDATFDKAVSEYRRALQLDPQHAEAAFYLGRLLAWTQHHEEAAAAFGQAVEAQPYWADALMEWGQELEASGKKREAEDAYLRVLATGDAKSRSNAMLMARARLQRLFNQERAKTTKTTAKR